MKRQTVLLALTCIVSTWLVPATATASRSAVAPGPDDVVVVAILDNALAPYHWDFSASKMPQQTDSDPTNNLPLGNAPHSWLPGFPSPTAFTSYDQLSLTLNETNPNATVEGLTTTDQAKWDSVKRSSAQELHYYWLPGTKVIGAVTFTDGKIRGSNESHGTHTSAIATGNIHGSCPSCVLVFVQNTGEAAIEWALDQPWIDVISNSYGYSLVNRDRLYSGSDTEAQRRATERGQHILFSAGNGQGNDFLVPNTTYFSSQEGPDWITTVGAVSTTGGDFSGSGKMADIAAPGISYPSIGGATVTSEGSFSGTSNATPLVAGLYSHALGFARAKLSGPRTQSGGVIASGEPIACAAAYAACDLGDGVLTRAELTRRLLEGATPTGSGFNFGGIVGTPVAPREGKLASQGHGAYRVRHLPPESQAVELERLMGPLDGTAAPPTRPADEKGWFVVDSYCRQEIWGSWREGYYVSGVTALPQPEPLWPLRNTLAASCDHLFPPV